MITEDYCSFEVSKLLKEKGFGEPNIRYGYNKDGKLSEEVVNWEIMEPFYPRVTLQMAMKWLREEFDLNIEIDTIGLKDRGTLRWRSTIYNLNNQLECYYDENCSSYEEAVEVALKYCLENLI